MKRSHNRVKSIVQRMICQALTSDRGLTRVHLNSIKFYERPSQFLPSVFIDVSQKLV